MSYITDLRAYLDSNAVIFASLDDQQAADKINALEISTTKTRISADELLNAVDNAEYNALTDAKKQMWLTIVMSESGANIANPSLVNAIGDIWGAGSKTYIAFDASRNISISIAMEQGWRKCQKGHIEMARALP